MQNWMAVYISSRKYTEKSLIKVIHKESGGRVIMKLKLIKASEDYREQICSMLDEWYSTYMRLYGKGHYERHGFRRANVMEGNDYNNLRFLSEGNS